MNKPKETKLSPTQDETDALQRFANKHGRNWKQALGMCWYKSNYNGNHDAPLLQGVRNKFGPRWLYRQCHIQPVEPTS